MKKSGSVVLLVLVFGGIFFAVLAALSGFVLTENRAQDVTRERAEAFTIAEAGLQYYRWFLSHFAGNTQNGTGHNGPFTIPYADPEGGTAGSYTLSIVGNSACGVIQSIDVTSKGVPTDAPSVSNTLWARYAPPSVAAYSYIIAASVWAGPDRIINGPYHSNGGVRMDGTANAPVTSSLSSWDCTTNFGCNPAQHSAPGVVGSGGNQNLWSYPTPQVDFSSIDFTLLKTTAQTSGKYFARVSSGTGASANIGWHIVFNSNGTYTVKQVTSVTGNTVTPINSTDSTTDYSVIAGEGSANTYTLPSSCGLIFVEDNVWLEGTIPQKVTVVAGDDDQNIQDNAYLRGNLQYAAHDGSDGLTVIARHDVLISGDSPQTMTLNGIFIADNGAFGRNLFLNGSKCNSSYEPRTQLNILGTTVSSLRTGTQWSPISCGSGTAAGYLGRIDSFDRQNVVNPPPFTPITSTQWQFVSWQQK